MLLSIGYELPKRIFVHGFLTVDGQKISKSLGNVIDPVYLAKTYSTDALRYFLVREVSFGQDGDFSEESLRKRLNTELADIFGNFVHRVFTFIRSHFDGKVPEGKIDKELEAEVRKRVEEIERLLDRLEVTQAVERTIALAGRGNEYFQSREPWKAIKADPQKAADCLLNCVNLVKILCIALSPLMPFACEGLAKQLNVEISSWEQAKKFDLKPGHVIGKPEILFKKIQIKREEKGRPASMEDFNKLDIRIGNIVKAEKIKGYDKLLKLELELAEERRTIVAGIAENYSPQELVGKQVAVVTNLKPVKLAGIKSEGMLLAALDGEKISILTVDKTVKSGQR
jgi:methionyl-tRNA synthetase